MLILTQIYEFMFQHQTQCFTLFYHQIICCNLHSFNIRLMLALIIHKCVNGTTVAKSLNCIGLYLFAKRIVQNEILKIYRLIPKNVHNISIFYHFFEMIQSELIHMT